MPATPAPPRPTLQYPMASPGGYQLVGRTLPIWNPFTRTGPFQAGKPWLLRNFDQARPAWLAGWVGSGLQVEPLPV